MSIITITNIFCSRHSTEHFICNISFNPHKVLMRYLPILPILWIRIMSLKRSNYLPKITQ